MKIQLNQTLIESSNDAIRYLTVGRVPSRQQYQELINGVRACKNGLELPDWLSSCNTIEITNPDLESILATVYETQKAKQLTTDIALGITTAAAAYFAIRFIMASHENKSDD